MKGSALMVDYRVALSAKQLHLWVQRRFTEKVAFELSLEGWVGVQYSELYWQDNEGQKEQTACTGPETERDRITSCYQDCPIA